MKWCFYSGNPPLPLPHPSPPPRLTSRPPPLKNLCQNDHPLVSKPQVTCYAASNVCRCKTPFRACSCTEQKLVSLQSARLLLLICVCIDLQTWNLQRQHFAAATFELWLWWAMIMRSQFHRCYEQTYSRVRTITSLFFFFWSHYAKMTRCIMLSSRKHSSVQKTPRIGFCMQNIYRRVSCYLSIYLFTVRRVFPTRAKSTRSAFLWEEWGFFFLVII